MDWYIIAWCIVAAFFAGFVDAVAGGGGLIQLPALFIAWPLMPFQSVIGTNKFANFCGTSLAASRYWRQAQITIASIMLPCIIIFCGAYIGTWCLQYVEVKIFKLLMLIVLIGLALFLFFSKNFGMHLLPHRSNKIVFYSAIFVCGLYDGFIGPGTGILIIIAYIFAMGHDFFRASAHAKVVNLCSNLASVALLALHGHIVWWMACAMAVANMYGAWYGTRMAMLKGNQFIRQTIFIVIALLLFKFGYDVGIDCPH